MKLDRALKENPYNRERGKVGAYIRYLRYNVDGWYNKKSADIRKELVERKIIYMKAKFKMTRTADGFPLTFGKMYDVLDVKRGKKSCELKEIKVKNDLGQERWYSANKFKLFAEAAAFLKEPTVAGAGQSAGRSATPDGKQIYMGIDPAGGTDMAVCGKSLEMTDIERVDAAAGDTARAALKIGEAVAAGIAAGLGLRYGA